MMVVDILKELIRIDTRSSCANETEAAVYLKNICDRYNIDNEIVEPVKGKGSIVAHIPGRDKNKGELLLLSHLDTAEYGDLGKWKFHPCSAAEYKGRIFGRGTIDCKGLVSLWLSMLINIRERNVLPERGIIFAAVSDEENGGKYGMEYLIENNQLIRNCWYVIGEGGGFPIKLGNTIYFTCQNAEKGKRSYQIDNAEMDDVEECKETYVGEPVKALIKGLSATKIYNMALVVFLLKQSLMRSNKRRIDVNSLLCSSYNQNRTRQKAMLNISYLPGTNEKAIERILKNTGLNDYDIRLTADIPPSHTAVDTHLYDIIAGETAKQYPKSKVIPYTTPGYSDNRFLRDRGKVVYGYFPLSLEDELSGIHGYNEHISISGLLDACNLMYNVLTVFCGIDNNIPKGYNYIKRSNPGG